MRRMSMSASNVITALLGFITMSPATAGNQPYSFTIADGSKQYHAQIQVEKCDNELCEGKGTVQLSEKSSRRAVQTFHSDNLTFFLTKEQKPTVNIIQLYNEQSPLIFNDFNFDGTEDLAIRNGNESGYSGPSYDVYVFNQTRGQFILSKELTDLAHENLGMFETDAKRQRLITFSKSGCCWHQTTEYAVVPKRGLVVMKELTEDALRDERFVYVTTRTRSSAQQARMTTQTKKYKAKDYYGE